jgi:recombination protein RecA
MAEENKEQEKELKATLDAINKKFGEGSIQNASDVNLNIERLPTGIFSLDLELGGGLPAGRIVEMYGKEQSLKSTIALRAVAQAQKAGKLCAYIDIEGRLDLSWAKRQGVDIDKLKFSRPETGERAGDIADTLVRSGLFAIVVIDSVSALIPQADTEQTMENTEKIGARAMLCNRLVRKVHSGLNTKTSNGSQNQTCVIFINQIRLKIGVFFGNPEDTTGGLGLRFGASVRLEVRKSETLKNKNNVVGFILKFKTTKNTTFMPYRTGQFKFYLDGRIDNITSLLDYGIMLGAIKQKIQKKDKEKEKSIHYVFNEIELDNKEELIKRIVEDDKFRKQLAKDVRILYGESLLTNLIESDKKEDKKEED